MNAYRKATNHVCDVVEEIILEGKIDYPDSTFGNSVLGHSKNIHQKHRPIRPYETAEQHGECFTLYYDVQPYMADVLLVLAPSSESFYDYCVDICSTNLLSDMPLPEARPGCGQCGALQSWGALKRSRFWFLIARAC
jgi:hypothetical protein